MVLSNTPGANSDVNYSVYRDQSANVSYLVRVIGEASTTVMQVSASVAYSVSDFNKEYVEGAQAITAYANTTTAQRITSNISINTTDKNSSDTTDGNATVFITQDNAERLKSLNSGVNYILMGDIDLSEIPSLKEKDGWKPVAFPENSTLDGNNFKIFFLIQFCKIQ